MVKKITLREPRALKELHDIRRQIQRQAEKVGWERYLEDLNKKPGWLVGKAKRAKRAAVVRERRAKYKAR